MPRELKILKTAPGGLDAQDRCPDEMKRGLAGHWVPRLLQMRESLVELSGSHNVVGSSEGLCGSWYPFGWEMEPQGLPWEPDATWRKQGRCVGGVSD